MKVNIRVEQKGDAQRITEINTLAFKQPNEGKMVEALRNNPRFIPELSLVAEYHNEIIGHILFFPVDVKKGSQCTTMLSLAPLAVHPTYQKKGVGGTLIKAGVTKAKTFEYPAVLVVGHPTYYPRFGFVRASTFGIRLPLEAPDEASMALELRPHGLKHGDGVVEYPVEYYGAL